MRVYSRSFTLFFSVNRLIEQTDYTVAHQIARNTDRLINVDVEINIVLMGGTVKSFDGGKLFIMRRFQTRMRQKHVALLRKYRRLLTRNTYACLMFDPVRFVEKRARFEKDHPRCDDLTLNTCYDPWEY